jgi:hypothetical protein
MPVRRFASAFAGLLAMVFSATNVIAEPAGSTTFSLNQTTYETKGASLDSRELRRWAEASYWEQKVLEAFDVAVDRRMQTNAEERDAVLAAVWQIKPQVIGAETAIVGIIPKRASKPRSTDVAYQIVFTPRASPRDKDRVEVRFVTEGFGSKPVMATAAGPILHLPSRYTYAGFPQNNNILRYWAEHPNELKSILAWIAACSNPSFDQILTIGSGEGTAARQASFLIAGTKVPSGGPILTLRMMFLGDAAPVTVALPERYDANDFADLQIEKAQGRTAEHDKLGVVTGISELAAEERLPAKFALMQYFASGTREAEVDAIVPIPNGEKRTFLTMSFGANNDVSIRHIAEDSKGSMLGRLGELRQVNGFSANSNDVPALLAWLKKRYPGVKPKGATAAELESNVTAEIQAKSGAPTWFKENYGIDILTATDAQGQLSRLFPSSTQQFTNLQEFTPAELQMLEVTLERLSDQLASKFKGLQMARQKVAVQLIGVTSTKFAINDRAEAGVALLHGSDRAIVIFDSVNMNAEALFMGGSGVGGKPQIATGAFNVFAHELGHVIAAMPGVKQSFEGLVKAKKIKPVTWYAASNPKDEFFAEAFALYTGDPEWLKTSRPELFSWFETLARGEQKTGMR